MPCVGTETTLIVSSLSPTSYSTHKSFAFAQVSQSFSFISNFLYDVGGG